MQRRNFLSGLLAGLALVATDAVWAGPLLNPYRLAAGGGGGPTGPIVQSAMNSNASAGINSVTLSAAPTNGHLLIALISGANVTGATGWTRLLNDGTGTTWSSIWYKFAGPGESTTQTMLVGSNPVVIALYEIATATTPTISVGSSGSATSRTLTLTNTASPTDIILGMAAGDNTNALPSSIGTATSDGTIIGSTSSNLRSMQAFHRIGTSTNQSETVTYAASTNFRMAICIVAGV